VLTLESAEAQQAGMSHEKKENFFELLLELLYSADVKVGVALKKKNISQMVYSSKYQSNGVLNVSQLPVLEVTRALNVAKRTSGA
jgi:hypothetical protein